MLKLDGIIRLILPDSPSHHSLPTAGFRVNAPPPKGESSRPTEKDHPKRGKTERRQNLINGGRTSGNAMASKLPLTEGCVYNKCRLVTVSWREEGIGVAWRKG